MSNILSDVKLVLDSLHIPNETAKFSKNTPGCFAVLIPLTNEFEYSDNLPSDDIESLRISVFVKGNYIKHVDKIVKAIINADLTITNRKFIDYEEDTFYYHYVIDVENNYKFERKENE